VVLVIRAENIARLRATFPGTEYNVAPDETLRLEARGRPDVSTPAQKNSKAPATANSIDREIPLIDGRNPGHRGLFRERDE